MVVYYSGTVIEQVSATDADSGINAEIQYQIMKGGYDDFFINNITGQVFIIRSLNYDNRNQYSVEIVASDKGKEIITNENQLHH